MNAPRPAVPPPLPSRAAAPLPGVAGLRSGEVAQRRAQFGSNRLAEIRGRSFLSFVGSSLADRTLLLLLGCAAVVLVLDVVSRASVVDGAAILVAVAVASFVTSFNEWRAQAQFKSLQREQHDFPVKVVRDGRPLSISAYDLVVDDVVELEGGDKVPADGRLARSNELQVNESTLTGESLPAAKSSSDDALLRAGTLVVEGTGTMVVTAVGDRTEYGRLRSELAVSEGPTPLQQRLGRFADRMSLFALVAAAAIFVALVVPAWVRGELGTRTGLWHELFHALVLAVTVVVVAVPEGLPVAVTLSLAWSVRKLAKQGCLVRRLLACETIGSVEVVLTDKTGTLTLNRMRVERLHAGDADRGAGDTVDPAQRELVQEIASVDSTARLVARSTAGDAAGRDGEVDCLGSPTEGALLELVASWGGHWRQLRESASVVARFGFTSERKRMTTVVRRADGGWRVLTKGAPEVVLARCTRMLGGDGATRPLDERGRAAILARVDQWSRLALRGVAFAFRDLPASGDAPTAELESELTYVAVAGLGDPVRPEARGALASCRAAGVDVRIVTGDNRLTAEAVAREVGLLESGDRVVDAAQLRERNDEEALELLRSARVVSRAVPSDKLRIVELWKKAGKVVAVTGDGTNDAPALRRADVGIAMGRTGTDVAREASDLVLRDDHFATIVHAIESGRAIFENVRKFVQFQLTVNLVALALSFVAGVTGHGTPLTVVQLLWVNLIMDALAALALATEPADPQLLAQPPRGRDEPLITGQMKVMIAVLGAWTLLFPLWFVFGRLFLEFALRKGVDVGTDPALLRTAIDTCVFNLFVMLQLGNLVNARTTTFRGSALRGITKSKAFLAIVGVVAVLQIAIVQLGGGWFGTTALRWSAIAWQASVSLSVVGTGALLRLVGRAFTAEEPGAVVASTVHVGRSLAAVVRRLARIPAWLAQPGSAPLAWSTTLVAALLALTGVVVRTVWVERRYAAWSLFATGISLVALVAWKQRSLWLARPALRSPRLHALLCGALLCVLVADANWLASRHFTHFDLTADQRHELSPATLGVLVQLDRAHDPVRVTTVFRPDPDPNSFQSIARKQVHDLLAEYRARCDAIELHELDPEADAPEVQRLHDRLGSKPVRGDSIVLEHAGHTHVVSVEESFPYRNGVDLHGQRFRLHKGFRGEELVTSALLAFVSPETFTVCFAVGHGERSPDDFGEEGLAVARDRLRREGFKTRSVTLFGGAPVPDDCAVLVQAGPRTPIDEADRKALRDFLARGGKWLLTLEPFQTAGLEPLLKEWNLEVRPCYVVDPDRSTAGREPTTIVASQYQPHPIVDALRGVALTFSYATSVHHTEPTRSLESENVALTSPGAVGIADANRTIKEYDRTKDLAPSPTGYSLAVAVSEPVNRDSADGRREPARVVVVGDTDFATTHWIDRGANADFFLNCVDWLARREERISLRPRDPDLREVTLSVGRRTALWWLSIGLLPGLVAALGGIVAWRRRA
jgi:Ca2+-transporting ATPase